MGQCQCRRGCGWSSHAHLHEPLLRHCHHHHRHRQIGVSYTVSRSSLFLHPHRSYFQVPDALTERAMRFKGTFKPPDDTTSQFDASGAMFAGLGTQAAFLQALQAMQRLGRASERKPPAKGGTPPTIVLKLTPTRLALGDLGGSDTGAQTWTHFDVKDLFLEDYKIESKRGNEIDLEVPIPNLMDTLRSCSESARTAMKLANGSDGRPVIRFEFFLRNKRMMDVCASATQDVCVRVIPEDDARNMKEPELPEPQYQIDLSSSFLKIKNVTDKMRAVGAHYLVIEAGKEKAGQGLNPTTSTTSTAPTEKVWVRLVSEADYVTIASTFPSLPLIMVGKETPSPDGPIRMTLTTKRFGEVLTAVQLLGFSSPVACLVEGRVLVIYAKLAGDLGAMISFMPEVIT
uniref:Checkpoint protein HUS1 n=1 Tax=Crypthecodinium cohnii TaxID=2866 RepID=A0A516AGT6_CRYCO|nr:checkpoint protein HUS1 [Crypthecodinium cohnii]